MTSTAGAVRRTHPLLWVAVAAMALLTVIVVTSPLTVILDGYLHDDSFYYLTVAENLARGHGSTFDGINYTNGYQPGWFVIVTALYAAGLAHDAAVPVLIAVQALLHVGGLWVLASAFVRLGVDRASAAAAVGVVFVVLVPAIGWNLLESGLAFLASAALLHALARADATPIYLGLVVSFAGLARTDHLLFVPLVALLIVARARRIAIADAIGYSLPIVILIGGYLLFNLATTGHIMPVSGRVKELYSSAWSLSTTLAQLASVDVRQSWKLGIIVAVMVIARAAARSRPEAIAVYATGALAIFAFYQLRYIPQFSAAFWYYIPLYVLFSYGLARLFDVVVTRRGRRTVAVAALAVIFIVLIGARARLLLSYRDRAEGERSYAYRVAAQLRARMVSPQARAATWDAGIFGYFAGRVTNLDGLVNSADYLERYLVRGAVAEYVREQQFDFIVAYDFDLQPGGKAAALVDDYRPVYTAYSLVILERFAKNR